jgi:hypothetical protein
MRHLVFRGVLAVIWVVAAIICGINGDMEMAALYAVLGVVFGYTFLTMWKKRKEGAGK